MLNDHQSESIYWEIHNLVDIQKDLAISQGRISILLKPRLTLDGNKWMAIYGELVDGVVGVGDSPEEAYTDFDKNWYQKIH